MKIVFATNNQHKLQEIRAILGPTFDIVSLSDIGCHEDIPETGQTLEENALMKAEYVYNKYHLCCFADDTVRRALSATTAKPTWPAFCAN